MAAALREQTIDSERVIYLGPCVLIASKSDPGAWHVIEDGRCTCKGFEIHGRCRHVPVAALAMELDRLTAAPIVVSADFDPDTNDPPTCPKCCLPSMAGRPGRCSTCLLRLPE